jgi:hypothetical protein
MKEYVHITSRALLGAIRRHKHFASTCHQRVTARVQRLIKVAHVLGVQCLCGVDAAAAQGILAMHPAQHMPGTVERAIIWARPFLPPAQVRINSGDQMC